MCLCLCRYVQSGHSNRKCLHHGGRRGRRCRYCLPGNAHHHPGNHRQSGQPGYHSNQCRSRAQTGNETDGSELYYGTVVKYCSNTVVLCLQVTLITTPSGAEAQPLVQDLPVAIMASPTSEEPGSTSSTSTTTTAGGEPGDSAAVTGTETRTTATTITSTTTVDTSITSAHCSGYS